MIYKWRVRKSDHADAKEQHNQKSLLTILLFLQGPRNQVLMLYMHLLLPSQE